MKNYFFLPAVLCMLSACSGPGEFVQEDVTAFNVQISGRTDIEDAATLMELYYPEPETEGNSFREQHAEREEDGTYRIVLRQEGLSDDSQAGVQIRMQARQTGDTWQVLRIEKNWKCRQGRGHRGWGTEPCI
ncbi:MAG: hypothetical protein ACT6QS_10610 [Flavobacteriales bacterium]